MATWSYIDFSRPEAQRLADLTGVDFDLRSVVEYCDLFLSKPFPAASREESQVMAALCIAAVVSYGRTIATGVRSGITMEQLEKLPEHLLEAHKYFKDFRDKFVAHSVNAFEENSVKAYLVPEERGPRAVASISVQHARVMMLSPYDMTGLRDLANALLAIVGADTEIEKKTVLTYAQSLPIDPLYESDAGPAFDPRAASVSSPRRKFK